MRRWIAILALVTSPAFAAATEQADFTRPKSCAKPGFLCGQCEEAAERSISDLLADQVGTKRSIEDVLATLVDRVEKRLGRHLVPIYLGDSPSLMAASPSHPKVILKSPESEVLIAFNTDPKTPAYSTLETMRFEGRTGSFRLEQVLREANGRIAVRSNPASCVRCHGADPRPLWDTYRSWPGMLAGRDDLVEKDTMLAEPYLALLDRIDAAKTAPEPTELDKRLRVTRPTASRAELERWISERGWARVPHVPAGFDLKNRTLRTAELAGPGHVLFDQLSAALGCYMKIRIRKHLPARESALLEKGLARWKPGQTDANRPILDEWLARGAEFHPQLGPRFGAIYLERLADIRASHHEDDRIKVRRQMDWLKKLGASPARAWEESYSATTPFVERWFAIPDPGGVRGTEESDPEVAAFIEVLLNRRGRSLAQWSMSVGPVAQPGFRSFSFSDQLVRGLRD
jgi:hypothetical protein